MSRVSSTARRTAKSLASLAGVAILVASGLAMSAAPASATAPSLTVSSVGSQSGMPAAAYWDSVTYGNGEFVAVGEAPGYSASTDAAYSITGTTWTSTTLPVTATWYAVTYGNGEFVALASNGDVADSINGSTWTLATDTLPNGGGWQSLAYGNDEFVAVDAGSAEAEYSTNGSTWTEATLPSNSNWQSITYGNGEFVTVASESTNVAYSTNGYSWTSSTIPNSDAWQSLAYGNGEFVAISSGEDAYSANGISWTLGSVPMAEDWIAIAFGGGEFEIVNDLGETATSSDNGLTWTTAFFQGGFTSVTYGDNEFLALQPILNSVAISPDLAPATGNEYDATMDVSTNVTPTGNVTISDTAGGSCEANSWTATGSDGDGGYTFVTDCIIETAEGVGSTISATYGGSDYTPGASNTLTIDGPPSITSASITGTANVGDTLTAVSSGVSGYPAPAETYQWYDGSSAIVGATSETYTVQSSDLGDSINVIITESNGIGSPATATSTGTADVATAPSGGSGGSTPPPPTTTTTTPHPVLTTPPTPPSTSAPTSTKISTVNLGFPASSSTLPSHERSTLAMMAKTSTKGSRIVVTSFAKGNAKLARLRADRVAEYLRARTKATVTIRVMTTSGNKVTVVATKK